MPERQNTFRVESDEVQGEGSFVRLRRLSWEKKQEAQRLLADAFGGTMPSDISEVTVTSEFLRTNEAYTRQMIRACVVEWNWVGDQGQALPVSDTLPEDSLGDLSDEEVAFLVRALQTKTTDLKNSGSGSISTSRPGESRRRNTRN